MPDLADGESTEVQGSGSSVYTIRNVGGVYSCSCPAWRNQSIAIETRSCKHIRRLRGDDAETARVGSAAATPRATKSKEGEEQEAPVLLAEAWDGVVEVKDWWISEKLDGVRAYWDGTQFLSRLGNRFFAPDWFTAGLPDFPLDGELWLDRKQFQRTISIVRRQDQSEHWKTIRYLVFDAPQLTDPFEERLKAVEELFQSKKLAYASKHEHIRCTGIPHLKEELARVEALGGEGLMLRQPGSKYVIGRSSTLLKVKSFFDAEAEVIGHQGGAGRHKGRLGALQVRLPDGTEFHVGTGFSDKQRENPPPVGSKITFRYQELSDGGVPRFPSYVGLRQDEPTGATTKAIATPRKPATVSVPAKPVVTAPAASAHTRRFAYQDDKSDKFWEITVNDAEVTVRYGRTGSNGQTNTKTFANATKAQEHADKLIEEKTEKGYEEE
jgi:DNA ligase-1